MIGICRSKPMHWQSVIYFLPQWFFNLCLHTCVNVCGEWCICMWGQDTDTGCFPLLLSIMFWLKGSQRIWCTPIWQEELTSKAKNSPASAELGLYLSVGFREPNADSLHLQSQHCAVSPTSLNIILQCQLIPA